ncbi:hypothetical protein [Hydrogenophaga intermedia]|uniref:hypothetical protein n=1 Tax=Hydrogenophaga intermedia TaxID=65786 RepID=UPI00204307CD|nr:hypothetical protein [Hydrogenophaga intermedia]MCM3566378.1 hypothetical protein [Hydrogenophaga intermedia]
MFGVEKEPAGLDGSEGGDANLVDVSAKAFLRISVIEKSPVRVEKSSDSGATTYTWPEASLKARNRKPVSDLIEYLLDMVLGISNAQKSEQVGWREHGGEICPLTLFKISAGAMHSARCARLVELMAAVPVLLTSRALPEQSMPWLSPEAREKVMKRLDELLLTLGGRVVAIPIDITVDDMVVGTLSGTYAHGKPLEDLDPKFETYVGRVVNMLTDPPGFAMREIDSKKKLTIRAAANALDIDQLNAWVRDKQPIAVDVATTVTAKGVINHELVKVQEAFS